MKILQVAGIGLPVTPNIKYGGTERVVQYLDEVFTEMGHESIVAATGDSEVQGKLIYRIPESLWGLDGLSSKREIVSGKDLYHAHYNYVLGVLEGDSDIDIVHDHPGSGLVTAEESEETLERVNTPVLTTLHGAFSSKEAERYARWSELSKKKRIHFNAISQSQRKQFERTGINVAGVVYHGIPLDRFVFEEKKEDYLFSIGRISPSKGQDLAIKVAKETGRPLIIAGEVHSVNEAYWKEKVEPHIDGDQIKFVGSLTDEEKIPYFQNAAGLIFPIQWEEPFGLVMIEAMATGTPVVAFSRGSVPEVIKDGETGFIVNETDNKNKDLEALIEATNNLESLEPRDSRKHVEDNFSIRKEAENYLRLYDSLIN